MAIEFRCPSCQKLLRTADTTAGKQGRCPHCQSLMQIPATPTTEPAAAHADTGILGAAPSPLSPPPPPTPPSAPLPSSAPMAPSSPLTPSAPGLDLFGNQQSGLEPLGPASASSAPSPGGAAQTAAWNNDPLGVGSDGGGGYNVAPDPSAQGYPVQGYQPQGYQAQGYQVQGYPANPGAYPAQPYGGGYTSGAAKPVYTAPGYAAQGAAPGYGNPYAAPGGGFVAPGGGWGGGPAPHRGNTILTLGIIGLVTNLFGLVLCCCCPLLNVFVSIVSLALGIPAWVMGAKDLRAMAEGRMDPNGQGPTKTGMILGIVCVVLTVLLIIATIVNMIFGVAMNMQQFQDFQQQQ